MEPNNIGCNCSLKEVIKAYFETWWGTLRKSLANSPLARWVCTGRVPCTPVTSLLGSWICAPCWVIRNRKAESESEWEITEEAISKSRLLAPPTKTSSSNGYEHLCPRWWLCLSLEPINDIQKVVKMSLSCQHSEHILKRCSVLWILYFLRKKDLNFYWHLKGPCLRLKLEVIKLYASSDLLLLNYAK